MFCSSIRKRPEWATVPATLLQIQQPKWTEKKLETHDVAIPIPSARQQRHQAPFLFLLLSPTDVQPIAKSMSRIERLYHQTGGRDVGIIFLLNEQMGDGNGMMSFMELQASLVSNFDIPSIPITTVSDLLATLHTFRLQLGQTRLAAIPTPADPRTALLPFCYGRASMPEHTRNVLSDICHSIPELAKMATTTAGQETIRQYLVDPDPEVAQDVVSFWTQELYFDT